MVAEKLDFDVNNSRRVPSTERRDDMEMHRMLSRVAVVSNIFLPGILMRKEQNSKTFSEYLSVKMHG